MESRIELLRAEAVTAIEAASDPKSLDAARVRYLGKSGEITRLSEGMRDVAKEDRPRLGKLLNQLRHDVSASLEEKETNLAAAADACEISKIDITLPGTRRELRLVGAAPAVEDHLQRSVDVRPANWGILTWVRGKCHW